MSENTKAIKKRKSLHKDIESINKAKMPTTETPKQAKSTPKIQSEQKQISRKNKNKRKSLPANLVNGDGADSPKKAKIEPFLGTTDLFKEVGEKPKTKPKQAEKNVKGQKEKSKVKNDSNNAQKQSRNVKNKPATEKPLGKRSKQQKERYITMRTTAKDKLKQTLIQAAAGEETAINYLKERVLQILQKDTLTSTAKRKLKMFKKTLKVGGVDISIFEKDSVKKEISKVGKENQKTKNQKEGKKELSKSVERVSKPKSNAPTKIVKEEKKPTLTKTEDDSDEEDESEISETEGQTQTKIEEGSSEDDEEESGEDEESAEDESGEDLEDSKNSSGLMDMESIEEEESEEDNEDNAESEEDSDNDENDSDDDVSHKKAKISKKSPAETSKNQANETVSELTKNKSRYVLFVGNLPFDVTKEDINQHFAKIGKLKDIRIPLDKTTNKCRGFAYVELLDQTSYEKALSLHHTNLKGRRINVLYTQGGKKQGDEKKKEIKTKNFKLQAMRQEGKLSGSVKQSQKRAARRDKKRNANKAN